MPPVSYRQKRSLGTSVWAGDGKRPGCSVACVGVAMAVGVGLDVGLGVAVEVGEKVGVGTGVSVGVEPVQLTPTITNRTSTVETKYRNNTPGWENHRAESYLYLDYIYEIRVKY